MRLKRIRLLKLSHRRIPNDQTHSIKLAQVVDAWGRHEWELSGFRQSMVKRLNLSRGLHRQKLNDEDAQAELDKAVVGGFWLDRQLSSVRQ